MPDECSASHMLASMTRESGRVMGLAVAAVNVLAESPQEGTLHVGLCLLRQDLVSLVNELESCLAQLPADGPQLALVAQRIAAYAVAANDHVMELLRDSSARGELTAAARRAGIGAAFGKLDILAAYARGLRDGLLRGEGEGGEP
jgi:hypothetical protein